jgi:hypothetical protein
MSDLEFITAKGGTLFSFGLNVMDLVTFFIALFCVQANVLPSHSDIIKSGGLRILTGILLFIFGWRFMLLNISRSTLREYGATVVIMASFLVTFFSQKQSKASPMATMIGIAYSVILLLTSTSRQNGSGTLQAFTGICGLYLSIASLVLRYTTSTTSISLAIALVGIATLVSGSLVDATLGAVASNSVISQFAALLSKTPEKDLVLSLLKNLFASIFGHVTERNPFSI